MTTLFEIIKSLQSASGNNEKLAILQAHKDDELLKAYLKATYDPAISYYQKAAPKCGFQHSSIDCEFGMEDIIFAVETLAGRKLTGTAAIVGLAGHMGALTEEGRKLMSLLISRSVGAGVGDTMILKTWPDLYFIPGYMRCSLMTPKIKKHFESLDKIVVQKKADGSFLYVRKPLGGTATAFTRAGSHYPSWFVERLLVGAPIGSYVLAGELLVYKNGTLLDRSTGNGVLNSILQGSDIPCDADYIFKMEAWDCLGITDFEAGESKTSYDVRLNQLILITTDADNISVIETDWVDSLDDAYEIYSKYTSQGMEGAVIKDAAKGWKDHTSPFNVKLKLAFEAEYVITGMYEGTGKAKGMMGGITIETSDGLLKCNCGSGFSDAQRQDPPAIGSIVTIIANDVVSSRGSATKSLFLPIYSETRLDKKEADSLARVMEQLEAAKSGK